MQPCVNAPVARSGVFGAAGAIDDTVPIEVQTTYWRWFVWRRLFQISKSPLRVASITSKRQSLGGRGHDLSAEKQSTVELRVESRHALKAPDPAGQSLRQEALHAKGQRFNGRVDIPVYKALKCRVAPIGWVKVAAVDAHPQRFRLP